MSIAIRSFDAVIFDLDGTLIDSLGDLADAINHVLRANSLPPLSLQAVRANLGGGVNQLVQKSSGISDPNTVDRFAAEMKRVYATCGHKKTRIYDGIQELLSELNRLDVQTGVLSNKPHDLTVAVIDQLFPDGTFCTVLGARPNYPLKPDSKSAMEIAEQLKIDHHRCLYVGDTEVDMRTAANAGFVPVGVSWGFRAPNALVKAGATHVIQQPNELIEILLRGAAPSLPS